MRTRLLIAMLARPVLLRGCPPITPGPLPAEYPVTPDMRATCPGWTDGQIEAMVAAYDGMRSAGKSKLDALGTIGSVCPDDATLADCAYCRAAAIAWVAGGISATDAA